MARSRPASLPFWMLLILALCLLGLATHFLAESMGAEGLISASSETTGHSDDDILLFQMPFLVTPLILALACAGLSFSRHSFGRPPLLPPPNS